MPGQSRPVPRHPVSPKLPHHGQVHASNVVVLQPWVVIGVVGGDEVPAVVEAGEADVQSAHEGLTLVDDH